MSILTTNNHPSDLFQRYKLNPILTAANWPYQVNSVFNPGATLLGTNGWWDANKIGLSPPPIETSQGWLVIYHGVKHNAAGAIYRLGLALFDLNEPERCLKRSNEWVFGPQELYEQHGDVGKVVFPCGTTLAPDGDTLRMYYGA